MRKVLIIANLFHASPRIPGITAFLPDFGWHATVVTPSVDERAKSMLGLTDEFFKRTRVVSVDYQDIFSFWRKVCEWAGFNTNEGITQQIKSGLKIKSKKSFVDKLLALYKIVFGYPDSEKNWIKPAFDAVSSLLENEKFDAILSSSPYPTSHVIAAKIVQRFNIPWVAEFRDPWAENFEFPLGFVRQFFDRRLERKTMSLAKKIIAVAPAYADVAAKTNQMNVDVVTNGFDPTMVNRPPRPLTRQFTITYTGTLYEGKRDPQNLFIALRDILDHSEIPEGEIEVRFYGKQQSWLQAEIKRYGLETVVAQRGQLDRIEALERQRESQVLLLIGWGSEDSLDEGIYPGKIFEYFAAQRPILVVGGPKHEAIKDIVEQTGAGKGFARAYDVKQALLEYYDEFKKGGAIEFKGDLKKIDQFNNQKITEKIVGVLEAVLNK